VARGLATAWAILGLLGLAACRTDRDGDGFVGRDDCDDADPTVFPGAPERCNGADDDCDHLVDEVGDVPPWFADADGDGFGDPDAPVPGCPRDEGVPTAGDCDDTEATTFPGAPEACDTVDNDCDGAVDEDPDPPRYRDDDADGFGGVPAGCEPFTVATAGDCDDRDDTRYPGAPELCDGLDNDCDGQIDGESDSDGDGVRTCDADCDDADPLRAPGKPELCNGIDDDCDEIVDGVDSWFDPRWPVRVPVQATSQGPTTRPILLDLDGERALAGQPVAFDPDHVRVMHQDCVDGALTELPATFLDGQLGLDRAGDPSDPLDNGRGALVILYDTDGDLGTVETWDGVLELAVYLGGPEPAPDWPTDLVAAGTTLTAGGMAMTVRDDRGGLVDLSVDGTLVASQADAEAGNGLRTSAGSLSAAHATDATSDTRDAGPVTAFVLTEAELDNGAGAVFSGYGYRRFAGRPEMWVRHALVTTEPTTIAGPVDRTSAVRPWQMSLATLTDPVATFAPDLLSGHTVAEEGGVAWRWVAPPAFVTHANSDETETWTAANDLSDCCYGTSGGVPAGAEVVDGGVLVVHPHLETLDAAAWADSLVIDLVVREPEPLLTTP